MALSWYCKKCKLDVPAGDTCPHCGGKLSPASAHVTWCVNHHPLLDWFAWNRIMRLIIPVFLLVALLALGLEAVTGGTAGVEDMLRGGFFRTLGILFLALCAICAVFFLLGGPDVRDITVDSRGVHMVTYMPSPSRLRLLARLQSPALLTQSHREGDEAMPKIAEQSISWSEVQRVQLWPEKSMVLIYAPVWLLRLDIPCTPYTFDDTLSMIRDKLGKKKKVVLPQSLRPEPAATREKPKKSTTRKKSSLHTTSPAEITPEFLDEIRKMNAQDEQEAARRP